MKYKSLLTLITVLALSACTIQVPPYRADISNVSKLKEIPNESVSVGKIKSEKNLNKISLRSSPLVSSVGDSYGEYIENALLQELKLAKLWSGVAKKQVSGSLVDHDIDVTGFSEGDAFIKVNFVVSEGNVNLFEKTISAEHTFDSSFMGAIAIPNGQQSYVELVQKLLKNLYSDKDFIEAIK
ncbi:MAG TPA: hypothetical protein ENH88_19170 [Pseudoalteromonas prydzensis]|uniref:ABC-type transport auxiliary lipoprotein component domain-containing protein n=1 Tax=Pseudoalteromonas prydzensis TaxID=182141 RepID=A0A7V1D235_9GAMM|nr:hypothetical protein [Pseudoalteromonas prydzensis]HEA18523.1 hypothetical protein [Pseudoalteromonas prydzensis]